MTRRRAENRRPVKVIQDVPPWIVTFGDMMGLILTFFILLFSISELKDSRKIYDPLQRREGTTPSTRLAHAYAAPPSEARQQAPRAPAAEEGLIGAAGPSAHRVLDPRERRLHPRVLRDGVYLRLEATVPFAEGGEALPAEGRRLLELEVVPAIVDGRFKVVIRGHVSPGEADGPEAEHRLGYRRARSVHDHLVASGIAADRLELQSAGSRLDVAPLPGKTLDPAARRRVEILLSPLAVGPRAEG